MRILIGVLFFCAVACIFGQNLPIREGLWENTVLDDDGSIAMRSLSCITQKSIADMIVRANNHPGCTASGQNITSHSMTVDISCSLPRVKTSTHSLVELLDSEHCRSTTTMRMTINGRSSESTSKSTCRFVKSDCGSIKPGSPEITSQ